MRYAHFGNNAVIAYSRTNNMPSIVEDCALLHSPYSAMSHIITFSITTNTEQGCRKSIIITILLTLPLCHSVIYRASQKVMPSTFVDISVMHAIFE